MSSSNAHNTYRNVLEIAEPGNSLKLDRGELRENVGRHASPMVCVRGKKSIIDRRSATQRVHSPMPPLDSLSVFPCADLTVPQGAKLDRTASAWRRAVACRATALAILKCKSIRYPLEASIAMYTYLEHMRC